MGCLKLISYVESSVDQLPGDARSSVLFGQQWLGASDWKKESTSTVKKGDKRPPLASQAGFAISVTRLAAGE